MCTVSWIHEARGYQLLCNRDELHTRKSAEPPREQVRQGVRVIAPRDGDYGGSWISVNEHGLSLSLLNRYQEQPPRSTSQFTSRGSLLRSLSDCRSLAAVVERVGMESLSNYQPFTLLALAPARPALIATWDGRDCALEANGESRMPLSSSSFEADRVVRSRITHFKQLAVSPISTELLAQFHRSHHPSPSAFSTCMHRDDAATVSFSRIRVAAQTIEFWYHPASPCQKVETEYQSIQL